MLEGKPTAPFMKYVGGKRWLAQRIIGRLPQHICYVEPFGGMGAVLLAKPRSKVEVWNDIDGGLANVMRVAKYHPDALADEMRFMLMHRAERLRWLHDAPGETDIQRAARWIMVRHTGFQGGATNGFQVSKTASLRPRDALIEDMLAVSRRLSSVTIESVTWQRVFDLYDAPGTVFFCDPPYADGDQKLYNQPFAEADHRQLAERLMRLKGRWVLTYGDHPLIRELYVGCRIEEVRRVRKINQAARKEYVELIITPPEAAHG